MNGISAWQDVMNGFDFTRLKEILMSVLPALLCITVHELCHGYAALLMGDTTARDRGRLTLNPLKHIDPVGLFMMVVFHFGWAKPVPVNMYRFKNPKRGMALTALAGPVSNLLLCLLFMVLYGALYIPLTIASKGEFLLDLLVLTAYLSLALGIFNMLPVPPLDGSKVLASVIPSEKYDKLMHYERYGMILMVILTWSGILSGPLSRLTETVFDSLSVVAQWSCNAVFYLFYK